MKHYMQEGMMQAEVIPGRSYEESWLVFQLKKHNDKHYIYMHNRLLQIRK